MTSGASTSAVSIRRAWPTGVSTGRRIVEILRPHRGRFAATVCLGLLQQGASVAAAGWTGHLVGLAATGGDPRRALPVLLALVATAAVAAWLRMVVESDLAQQVLAELRGWLYDAFERAGPARGDGDGPGELATAALADVARLDWFFARFLPSAAAAFGVPLVALGVLAALDPLLGLAFLPWIAAALAVPVLFRRRALAEGDALRTSHARLDDEVLEGIRGMREILAFGRDGDWLERLDAQSESLGEIQVRHGEREGLESALGSVLIGAGILAVLVVGALLARADRLELALLPAVVTLAGAGFLPIRAVAAAAARLGLVRASARRLVTLLDAPGAPARPTILSPETPSAAGLRFEAVRFRYAADRPEVLRGVDLVVEPGEHVALVGPSGAGKTTLFHLLLGFLELDSGRLSIGGHDLRHLSAETLRRWISWVPQDLHFFDESLLDNLRLGAPEAPVDRVWTALDAASVRELVETLPRGLETSPGERGVRFSGGERQRLAIARALVTDAPILLLDESTAALDAKTEARWHESLDRLRGERTLLVTAHRLSTIRRADRIAVLDGGRIVDQGSHEDLLERCAAYSRLVAPQIAPPFVLAEAMPGETSPA